MIIRLVISGRKTCWEGVFPHETCLYLLRGADRRNFYQPAPSTLVLPKPNSDNTNYLHDKTHLVHEFEELLFSDVPAFNEVINDEQVILKLSEIRGAFKNPEYIDDGIETAPSKRIRLFVNGYNKVVDRSLVSERIGIDKMIAECPHFAAWIRKIAEKA